MLKIAYACTGAMSADEFQSLLPYVSEERRLFLNSCKSKKYKFSSLAGEVLARFMLSKITGDRPESFIIARGEKRKPYLVNVSGLYFNISHTDTYVACAVSDSEVGLDLQRVVPLKANTRKMILSDSEQREESALSESEELEYTTKIWCKKESYYKFLGSGIDRRPVETDTKQLMEKAEVEWFEDKLEENLFIAICQAKAAADFQNIIIQKENLITPE